MRLKVLKRVVSFLLLTILGCFLFASSALAQEREYSNFTMQLSTKQRTWNSTDPLIVFVSIRNAGKKSFYVSHKCGFGFQGYLDGPGKDLLEVRYLITWDKSSDEICQLKSDDLIKIPAHKTVKLKLTSRSVRKLGEIPWSNHPVGEYRLLVSYDTPKASPFKELLLGGNRTQYVRIRVN